MAKFIDALDRLGNRMARQRPRRRLEVAPARAIVSFSFDDVPQSAMTNGARILEQHGARGTFYVAGGLTGQQHDMQDILDMSDYRNLNERGHEIACHTFLHNTPFRSGLGFAADLDRNARFLAGVTKSGPRNFAFPYGISSPWAQREIGRRFRSGRGVQVGINRRGANLDQLWSVELKATHRADERARFIDEVSDEPGWLIYFTHDVQESPTTYGCTPELLEGLVSRALERGCEVLTVDAALDRLGMAA